jgi:hypothetical protein
VTITSLTDTIYNPTQEPGTTCAVPQALAPNGGSYSCSFTTFVSANAKDISEMNLATASGTDDDGNPVSVSDDATVSFTNVPPAATLTKAATSADVTFTVVVTNDSPAELLELTALNDNTFGNITQATGAIKSTTCAVPQTIPVGGNYNCQFVATVSTSPHTDTVTGTVSDDEGGTITPFDSATVTLQ